jgi:hypothetical protein
MKCIWNLGVVIPVLRRLKQEFKVSLGYLVSLRPAKATLPYPVSKKRKTERNILEGCEIVHRTEGKDE